MLFCVGIYHPKPGKHDLPPDYVLTAEELRELEVADRPVTVEHAGIREAVAQLVAQDKPLDPSGIGTTLESLGDGHAVPVGVVITTGEGADGRFYALFAIDDDKFSSLPLLIRAGALRGISLTHRVGTPPLALELSLCNRPARPECYVLTSSKSLDDQASYLRKLITRTAPTMTTEQTPLQTVLEALPEEQRKIVAANFNDMLALVEKMKAQVAESEEKIILANKKAEEHLAQVTASTEANNKMLEAQVKMMSEQLNPSLRETYFCEAPNLLEELNSGDAATVRRATDRMICACNRQMMEDRANQRKASVARTTPVEKRKATEELQPTEDDEVLAQLKATFAV